MGGRPDHALDGPLVDLAYVVRGQLILVWNSPTLTTWGSLLVRFASVVLLLPIVLVRFTAEEVAVWQLFSALFVLGLLLDYGLAPTFIRLLSYARAGVKIDNMARVSALERESESVDGRPDSCGREIYSTMSWLYPRLSGAVTIFLAVFGTWSLYTPIGQLVDGRAAWLAWFLVVVTLFITVWGGCFSSALQGMNKIAPMRRWDMGFGIAQISSSMMVLSLGGRLFELVAVYQAWAVLGVLRNRLLLKSHCPSFFPSIESVDRRVLAAAGPPTWRSLISVLSSHGVIQLSGVFYGQMMPAAEVASYLLALRLITVVSQFSQAPFYTKLPVLAQLYASGRVDEALLLAARGIIAHIVFAVGALVAAFCAPVLLNFLHSKTAFLPPAGFALLALAFFAERYGSMHMQLYSLTNHIVAHYGYGATAALTCALTIGLWHLLGVSTFPAAMLIAYTVIFGPFSLHYSRKAFPIQLIRFEARTSFAPFAILATGLMASVVVRVI